MIEVPVLTWLVLAVALVGVHFILVNRAFSRGIKKERTDWLIAIATLRGLGREWWSYRDLADVLVFREPAIGKFDKQETQGQVPQNANEHSDQQVVER